MTYSLGCQFSEFAPSQQNPYSESLASSGGERGPVTFPAFKAGDAFLRGTGGGFDFHTPPPKSGVPRSHRATTECSAGPGAIQSALAPRHFR